MKFGRLLLFSTILFAFSGSIIATPGLNEIDSINNILSGDAIFDWDYNYAIINDYTFKDDSPLTHEINDIIEAAARAHDVDIEYKGSFLLGQLYFHKQEYEKAEIYFKKALKLSNSDIEFVYSSIRLADLKMETNFFLEALKYLQQAKQRTIQNDNLKLLARILLKEGYCYTVLKQYKTANNQLNKAYSIIESNTIRELYGEIFKYRGLLYFQELNYLNALANFYKGLEFYEQDTVIENYAIILDYLGRIYFNQGNYNKALEYYNDARVFYQRLYNIKYLGQIHSRLGVTHLKMHNYDSACTELATAHHYFSLFNSKNNLDEVNLQFAQLYIESHLPDSALSFLKLVVLAPKKDEAGTLSFEYFKQWTNYYLLVNKADSAVIFGQKANKLTQTDKLGQIEIHSLLADAYNLSGNYLKAYKYRTTASSLKDSVNTKINSYEIKVLQSELELSQKKVVIQNLTNERKIQDKTIEQNKVTIERQKVMTSLGIMVSLFLIILALLLGAFLYQKRRDNKKLNLSNKQIANQKEEIELQSQHLLEVNEELEKLSIVARETDNGIKIMNSVGRILWVNEGYSRMYGFTLSDLQKIENFDLLGDQANIDIQQLVNVWYGDKKPITFESLNKTKDNRNIWVQTTLTPILDEEGKINKMIAIDTDISRIKEAEQEILLKNQDITSSISYAKRIQEAMMTPLTLLTDRYPKSFCYYLPKSIVSGDFYWMTYRHDRLVIACADSTGHGVPGAFMSLIGMSFLNKIVNEKGFVSPDIILNRMRMNIINHLHQNKTGAITTDGMDMSIITIDTRNNHLEFAGAMNPAVVVRNNEIIELKPDRMPVGFFDNEERPFSSVSLKLEPRDEIFLYTDGYYDQFGGNTGAKMKGQRFKNILKKAALQPFEMQKNYIENQFDEWRGDYPQIDDVLILGIFVE